MKLSIIIPVYNEEKTVEEIIRKVKEVSLPKGIRKEIIVVDDGSTDKTPRILKKIKGINIFCHRINKGKGAAVRTGIKKTTGEIILIQDADLEYNPEDYKRLITPIIHKEALVVYGSRLKNMSFKLFGKNKTPMPTHYLGNKFLTAITNFLYGADLTDMETGYKVFIRKVLDRIELTSDRFEIEPEITAKVLKNGIKIKEIAIQSNPRGYEDGKKITWKDGISALFTLIKFRLTD